MDELDESDIQIISDHFNSRHSGTTGGSSPAPLPEARYRMYHGSSQSDVNPAAYHALALAYEGLKKQYNESQAGRKQLENSNRLMKKHLQSFMKRETYTTDIDGEAAEEDQGKIHDLQDQLYTARDQALQQAKIVEKLKMDSQEYRAQLHDAKSRILELERLNSNILKDNQRLNARVAESSGKSDRELEKHLQELRESNKKVEEELKQARLQLGESQKDCARLQEQVLRYQGRQHNDEEEISRLRCEVETSLRLYREGTGPVMDSGELGLELRQAKIMLTQHKKHMDDLKTLCENQRDVIERLISHQPADRNPAGAQARPDSTSGLRSPRLVARNGQPAEIPFADVDEDFPPVLQPTSVNMSPEVAASGENNPVFTPVTSRLPQHQQTQQLTQDLTQSAAGLDFADNGPSLPRTPGAGARSLSESAVRPGFAEPTQCSEDVFLQDIYDNKDRIIQGYMIQQQRMLAAEAAERRRRTQEQEICRPRPQVGQAFGNSAGPRPKWHSAEAVRHKPSVLSSESSRRSFTISPGVSPDGSIEPFSETPLRLGGHTDQARLSGRLGPVGRAEEPNSPVRTQPGRQNEPGETQQPDQQAAASQEPVSENRFHPAAANQQPRPLNINRNYNDDHLYTRGHNNTTVNHNIDRNLDMPGSSHGSREGQGHDQLFLNNDPYARNKPIPSQNLYQETENMPLPRGVDYLELESRNCPICDQDFPSTMPMAEVEAHVNSCLSANEYREAEATGSSTPSAATQQNTGSGKSCPVCSRQFPEETTLVELNDHVNTHFEEAPFEMLQT